jgi:hypothetical protein
LFLQLLVALRRIYLTPTLPNFSLSLFSQPEDVAAVNQIGAALCSAFAALEEEQGARHMEFVSGPMLKSQADKMAEVTPKLAEVEAAALADAAKAFEVNPEQDPPAEEPHELKKPAFEAQMVRNPAIPMQYHFPTFPSV